jgi:hypothetical protein
MTHLRSYAFRGAVAFAAAAAASPGCARDVTPLDCANVVEHLIDLKLREDPRYRELGSPAQATLRTQVQQESLSDPDVQGGKLRCIRDVTPGQVECAEEAHTSAQWRNCMTE